MSAFRDKLTAAREHNESLLCVGLDVDPRLAPPGLVGSRDWIERFALGIVEATADLVCAYKPNLGFYEALGLDGYHALRSILDGLPRDVLIIGDAKRGDVGSTAEAYARGLFEVWRFDAVTVSPYIGMDALDPFLRYAERGSFVVCKTSNSGSGDLQDLVVEHAGRRMRLYELVARRVLELNAHGNCGLVVGATYPDELGEVRSIAGDLPILVPGVGAQHGDLEASVTAGIDSSGGGIVVNSSRQVLYASAGKDWQAAARAAAIELRTRMEKASRTHLRAAG